MIQEAKDAAERPSFFPTGLDLFERTRSEQAHARGRYEVYEHFKSEYKNANGAMQRFMAATGQKEYRLIQARVGLLAERLKLESSEACGASYLKMLDELPSYGADSLSTNLFFFQCLIINQKGTASVLERFLAERSGSSIDSPQLHSRSLFRCMHQRVITLGLLEMIMRGCNLFGIVPILFAI